MGKKKYLYRIIINREAKSKNHYFYDYGNTRNMHLTVGNNCATVSFSMSVGYEADHFFENGITKDAIKKAFLVHILMYGRNINLDHLIIEKDGQDFYLNNDSKAKLYSLIQDNKKVSYSNIIKDIDIVINKILNTPINKSKDPRIACMYSFIMAERQEYIVEKFIFLWMSFNAFYNATYYYDMHKNSSREWECLRNLNKHYYVIDRNIKCDKWDQIKEKIAYQTYAVADIWNGEPVTFDYVDKTISKEIKNIFTRNKIDLESEYCYLLTGFSYFFRCNIIHGNKPLKLLCFEDERELKCIDFVNSLLEEFLKKHFIDIYLY